MLIPKPLHKRLKAVINKGELQTAIALELERFVAKREAHKKKRVA